MTSPLTILIIAILKPELLTGKFVIVRDVDMFASYLQISYTHFLDH